MKQIARMSPWRDGVRCGTVVIFCTIETAKFTRSFRAIIASGRVEWLALPVRSPDLNAYFGALGELGKGKCLSKVLHIGERFLRLALSEYVAHYHAERNHQGKANVLLFPRDTQTRRATINALQFLESEPWINISDDTRALRAMSEVDSLGQKAVAKSQTTAFELLLALRTLSPPASSAFLIA
jgi:hypothetical protein